MVGHSLTLLESASAGERNRSSTRDSAGKEPVKQKSRPGEFGSLSIAVAGEAF